jgi:hypothetical protein
MLQRTSPASAAKQQHDKDKETCTFQDLVTILTKKGTTEAKQDAKRFLHVYDTLTMQNNFDPHEMLQHINAEFANQGKDIEKHSTYPELANNGTGTTRDAKTNNNNQSVMVTEKLSTKTQRQPIMGSCRKKQFPIGK